MENGRRPKKNNATKIVKSKNNIIFENGRRPQIFFEKGRRPQLYEKIMQPITIWSKINDCGTVPGNLVISIYCD